MSIIAINAIREIRKSFVTNVARGLSCRAEMNACFATWKIVSSVMIKASVPNARMASLKY